MGQTETRVAFDKLVIGAALMLAGAAWFLGAVEVLHIRDLWRLWPVVLIVIGVANEAEAIRNRQSDGGWILLAIGTWFLVGNFELFGLSHGRALPVAVIVAGATIALHGIIDRPASPSSANVTSKEASDERRG